MNRRHERVAEQIRAVLAGVVREKLRDRRIGFVTLTDVELSPDLKHARVYVSHLGSEADRGAAVDALNHAAPFLRHELADRARLRSTPALRFVADPTLESGSRVEAILHDLHATDDEQPRDEPDGTP